MRLSRYFLPTIKETPADAEIISHQLMLRAGMIRKLAAGLYTWLPLGLRVLTKVSNIIREEMNRAGAIEVLMPAIQPAELWQETGRWDVYGSQLLRMKDAHQRDFCFGPTHEEVITDIARRELNSYKQLPVTFYQIQTKFRDEIRPRFGVMRAREFLMKDAYSFDLDKIALEQSYQVMYQAYCKIFDRTGLEYRSVFADSGEIGGSVSQEFHVLANSGEDRIAYCDGSDYAANVEVAAAMEPSADRPAPQRELSKTSTPNQKSIDQVSKFLDLDKTKLLKTLIVHASDGGLVALCVRGDHELNTIKAAKHASVASPLMFASEEEVKQKINCDTGYVGPLDIGIPVIADLATKNMADFVCGANSEDQHYTNVNWARDLPEPEFLDIRSVVEGDLSPDGKGQLKICRGIEVGHIFQLGQKYSTAMNATVLDENSKAVTMFMGCYGIGVSRIVAAAIEQNYDQAGIIWPDAIAPFHVVLIPINLQKSKRLSDACESLYRKLQEQGLEVLYDDRDERPGSKFANADLIGIPHRLVLSEKNLDDNKIEYKGRRESESQNIEITKILDFLVQRITP